MASKTRITITKRNLIAKEGYSIVVIEANDGETYTGLSTKFPFLPEEGDTGEIMYSKAIINGKEQRTILSFKEEYQEMATKKSTTTTTTGSTTSSGTSKTTEGLKIKGTLFYPHIKNPEKNHFNPTADPKYTLCLVVSENLQKTLSERGVEVKEPKGEISGNYVVIRSKHQPSVLDSSGNKLESIPLIGNGSTGIITVKLYPNRAPKGGKMCLGMSCIQLENLIEFIPPQQEVLE